MHLKYSKKELSQKIKELAKEIGFEACGFAPVEEVANQNSFLSWIKEGYQANMKYLENHFNKRMNPALLVPGSKTIIALALNYYPSKLQPKEGYQFSWYAYGDDYHLVMKEKLQQLFDKINTQLHPITGRVFVDTAPVLERYWAWRAGLGWIGKNTQLIIPKKGSCFFLGELIIDLELLYDTPIKNRCGNCTRCIDSCPTQALIEPFVLDSRSCLSYLTIENREDIPSRYHKAMKEHVYGCDECLKACPWNRFSKPTHVLEFQPRKELLTYNKKQWQDLTQEEYQSIFKNSAVKRTKYNGLKRNIALVAKEESKDDPL